MDPVEDEVLTIFIFMVDAVRGVGGFMKLRGLDVEGENEERVLDLKTLTFDEFLRGVTELPCLC